MGDQAEAGEEGREDGEDRRLVVSEDQGTGRLALGCAVLLEENHIHMHIIRMNYTLLRRLKSVCCINYVWNIAAAIHPRSSKAKKSRARLRSSHSYISSIVIVLIFMTTAAVLEARLSGASINGDVNATGIFRLAVFK